jgi:hypothetical protein
MERLKTTRENAPLPWIKRMILEDRHARLTAPQLMDEILLCEDYKDFFGRCCSGQKESEVPAELREEVIEDFSSNEGNRNWPPWYGQQLKFFLDRTV